MMNQMCEAAEYLIETLRFYPGAMRAERRQRWRAICEALIFCGDGELRRDEQHHHGNTIYFYDPLC
jgi:hypothetical protein